LIERLPAIATAATAAAATTTTAASTAATLAVITTAATTAVITTTTAVATTTAAVATTTATVPAATTAAAAVATAAAAITAAAAAAEAAASAAAALLALLGFVDAERAPIEGAAIHTFDGLGRLFGRTHGHEGEATTAAGLAVGDQVNVTDRAEFLERSTDAISSGVERKIPNVQTSVHRLLDLAQRHNSTRPRGGHGARKRVSEQILETLPTEHRTKPIEPWQATKLLLALADG
jgi:hypothetical protein